MKKIFWNTVFNSLTTKLILIELLVLFSATLQAQTWQWLKAGGNDTSSEQLSEEIKNMDSDPQGNVYAAFDQAIGYVIPEPFTISGYQVPLYSGFDSILASFACDGSLRWTVAIGGSYTAGPFGGYTSIHGAQIKSLKTDNQGNIYITGILNRGFNPLQPLYLSPNFTLPAAEAYNVHKEQFFIAKYNTNGVVQWVRLPEASDVVFNNNDRRAGPIMMDVDPNGTIHIDTIFNPGLYCNGALNITGNPGTNYRHILKYDTNGNYIGSADIDYSDDLYEYQFLHDPNNDRYYIHKSFSIIEVVIIGGQVQTKNSFVAAFDSNGAFLWKKENNATLDPFDNRSGKYSKLVIGNDSNLYLNCGLGPFYIDNAISNIPQSWNGQEIIPHFGLGGSMTAVSVVVKMDPNGNTIWMKHNGPMESISNLYKSVLSGNELAFCINYGEFVWDGITAIANNGNGFLPGILRINKDTGVGIGLDYLRVTSPNSHTATSIAAGPNGSYYLGGSFQGAISTSASGSPATVSTGGFNDFFIAKFGTSNCTLATTATNPKEVIQSYPNPVTTVLNINNKETITYFIYDSQGKKVQMNTLDANGSIDLQYLTQGIYLLQMTDGNGTVTTQKIIKD